MAAPWVTKLIDTGKRLLSSKVGDMVTGGISTAISNWGNRAQQRDALNAAREESALGRQNALEDRQAQWAHEAMVHARDRAERLADDKRNRRRDKKDYFLKRKHKLEEQGRIRNLNSDILNANIDGLLAQKEAGRRASPATEARKEVFKDMAKEGR
jgi:hypothetical protein